MSGIHMILAAASTASGSLASISDQSITQVSSTNDTAGYRLNSSGIAEQLKGATYTTLETWLSSGLNSDFEVRATLSSGSTPSTGTLGTWQVLSTSRQWTISDDFLSPGDPTSSGCVLLIEIRRVSDSVVVTSASITLTSYDNSV